MKKSKPKQRTNWKVALAAVLLVASAFGQDTAQLSKSYTFTQPMTAVFFAPEGQKVTFYLSELHAGHFIEITKSEKVIFSITPDGKSEHTDEYKPDAVAVQFWKDLTQAYGDVCKSEASK